ncbi:MAG: hypothetical protein ACTHJN_15130 [Ginsengibacter sp.]
MIQALEGSVAGKASSQPFSKGEGLALKGSELIGVVIILKWFVGARETGKKKAVSFWFTYPAPSITFFQIFIFSSSFPARFAFVNI